MCQGINRDAGYSSYYLINLMRTLSGISFASVSVAFNEFIRKLIWTFFRPAMYEELYAERKSFGKERKQFSR